MTRLAAIAASLIFSLQLARAQPPQAPPEITPRPSSSPIPKATPVNAAAADASPAPSPVRAETPAPTPLRSIADSLSDADVQQVIEVLKSSYLHPDALNPAELNRATVQGLIERLAPGATISSEPETSPSARSPFRTETIDTRIGYIRLGDLSKEKLNELDGALKNLADRGLKSAILDLRATPESSDFELAAEVVRRFCAKGRELFTVKRGASKQEQLFTSNQDLKFQGVLVVLIDNNTAGAAEIIAAALRNSAKALVVGENTTGRAVEYTETPLPSGKRLRVAVAEAVLPGSGRVYPTGVKPDIAVPMADEIAREILRQSAESGTMPFVVETERPHLNEASLVAGINPELDAIQAAQRNRGERPKPPLRDVQLQRAIDLITTIGIYEKKAAIR